MSKKYSQVRVENPAATLTGAEIFVVTQDGESVGTTVQEIADFTGGGLAWGGFISSAPSFPVAVDTQYVSTAEFTSGGIDVFEGSILFAPAGAASMSDLIIKP